MLMRQRLFFLLCLGFLPAALSAASFDITASVDRTEVELGEPFHYTLSLQVMGRMDFPLQVDQPKFDGFQASGPMRSDSSTWNNGAITEQHSFTWELVPIKAGTVVLPPIKADAKDAVNGEVVKAGPAITIQVKRPKNAYSAASGVVNPQAFPTYALPTQQDTPPPDADDGLRDIKADRALPWLRLAGVLGAFAGVLALLVLWARRPSQEENPLPQVRDPRSLALRQLDEALARLAAGDEKGFVLGVGKAVRGYLGQRLELRREATLSEAFKILLRQIPDKADQESAEALRLRLEVLLYADAPFKTEDKSMLDSQSRHLIDTLERLTKR